MCWPFSLFKKNGQNIDYTSTPSRESIFSPSPTIYYKNVATPIVAKECLYCKKIIYDKQSSDNNYHKECRISVDLKNIADLDKLAELKKYKQKYKRKRIFKRKKNQSSFFLSL